MHSIYLCINCWFSLSLRTTWLKQRVLLKKNQSSQTVKRPIEKRKREREISPAYLWLIQITEPHVGHLHSLHISEGRKSEHERRRCGHIRDLHSYQGHVMKALTDREMQTLAWGGCLMWLDAALWSSHDHSPRMGSISRSRCSNAAK